jgi:hypothetical protein
VGTVVVVGGGAVVVVGAVVPDAVVVALELLGAAAGARVPTAKPNAATAAPRQP